MIRKSVVLFQQVMAVQSDPSAPHPDLRRWIEDRLSSVWRALTRLSTVDNKEDPPEEPFRSLYAARELLTGMHTIQSYTNYSLVCIVVSRILLKPGSQ